MALSSRLLRICETASLSHQAIASSGAGSSSSRIWLFSAIGRIRSMASRQQHVDRVAVELELLPLLLDARERQQVLGNARQAFRIVADDAEETHVVRGIVDGAVEQRLGVALDRASGVRSSWETLMTKSLRTRSTFSNSACSRSSCSTVCCRFSAVSLRVRPSWPNSLESLPGSRARKLPRANSAAYAVIAAKRLEIKRASRRRDAQRRQERQGRARQDLPAEVRDLLLDLRERHRDPHRAVLQRNRDVKERDADGRAAADIRADLAAERPHQLRAACGDSPFRPRPPPSPQAPCRPIARR